MNRYLAGSVGLAIAASLVGGPALAQTKDQPIHVPAAQLSAMVAKTIDGTASAPVPMGPGAVMLTAHRDQSGSVEVHAKLNDEFIVRSGRATILLGEKVEGGRETAPGERRGGTIVGGQSYDVAPGDVLWIPAGMAHQVVMPKGGSFEYLAIKFPVAP